jgi:REP element-mobilizing transposase RayT
MIRQRHYENLVAPNQTGFFTTTTLDFVHVFARAELRDLMCASLLEDCRRTDTRVHAFVVMPHHFHLVASMGEGISGTDLMRRVKANSARRIRPLLDAATEAGFDEQRGLNRHTFWQRSFRSVVVLGPEMFRQKIRYTHLNPVRSGYCEASEEYRWSSRWAWLDQRHVRGRYLNAEGLRDFYAPDGLPSV